MTGSKTLPKRTVRLDVSGAVGSGKTQLVDFLRVYLHDAMDEQRDQLPDCIQVCEWNGDPEGPKVAHTTFIKKGEDF